MPVIAHSSYKRPFWLFNRHLETIKPAITRSVKLESAPNRERIDTADGDFLDLDLYSGSSHKVLIISHGLEGDSTRAYIQGMAKYFHNQDWSVIAWNYRGCSGEMNRSNKFYHSGASYDLEEVVNYAIGKNFENIALAGFSLGGNMTLKYLGEGTKPQQVKTAAVFSVPLDLAGCSAEIDKPHNILYSKRFLNSLRKKIKDKAKVNEAIEPFASIKGIKSIYQFDDLITAPLHGFDGADHYYETNSSRNFVSDIKVPTLVVNAANDPFLSQTCYDLSIFESLDQTYFEVPAYGGHVGFSQKSSNGTYWSEARAFEFISQYITE